MSVSSVTGSSAASQILVPASRPARAPDGDTVAQETAETPASKIVEWTNGGLTPKSQGTVNKTA